MQNFTASTFSLLHKEAQKRLKLQEIFIIISSSLFRLKVNTTTKRVMFISIILVIDDNPDNLLSISAVLSSLIPDCSVITADPGVGAIRKARTELPDTILLDIKMPEMKIKLD